MENPFPWRGKGDKTGFHGVELFSKHASMAWKIAESGFHAVENAQIQVESRFFMLWRLFKTRHLSPAGDKWGFIQCWRGELAKLEKNLKFGKRAKRAKRKSN